ncbi:winged helix-turn-helix domain-containing protein [Actinoplanes sp. CA-030573]|uniref:winged helix-turn-helix domain-containing protein n=1 Tax=Actinoplanes sp. CA-030573 TaxID=3239898 RepID=UPI003D8E4774
MRKPSVTGRGWAYIGAALGGTVSIAANVAHSYVPPTGAPAAWTPQTGAVVGAIFWPVALFVATEILARVAWPSGRRWTSLRFGGLLPVALVAAFVSYKHLAGLLNFYGEDTLTAMLGPLAVDGLMVMATGALLATARRVADVAEDIATVINTVPDAPAAPVAEVPPVPAAPVKKTPATRVTPRPASAAKVAKVAARMPGASVAEIAKKAEVSPSTVRRHLAALRVTNASPSAPQPAETPALAAA